MLNYLDRTFCDSRDCTAACRLRFYGTPHEANAKRVGLPVSMGALKYAEECKGYGPCGSFMRQREDAKAMERNTGSHRPSEPEANEGSVS